jgi:flagellar hook protein FlgE
MGRLSRISRFSNGIGQLALASFLSADGLACGGDDQWLASDESGEPMFGTPGSAGRGIIRARVIEQR